MYVSPASTVADKTKEIKADRNIFRRLFCTTASGRKVDLANIMKHELSPLPLSLAKVSGTLNIPMDKAALSHILADEHMCHAIPGSTEPTCDIIDGMALVKTIGKLKDASTFGDFSDVFTGVILSHLKDSCGRVDLIFDVYNPLSTKAATRDEQAHGARKIRHIVDSRDVTLPTNWDNFINLDQNKTNLCQFLAKQPLIKAETLQEDVEIVVAGGLDDPIVAVSSTGRNITHLHSTHEEADQRIILHAVDAAYQGFKRTVVTSRDTDVLVLLIHHQQKLSPEIWQRAGTTKEPRNIPIHSVVESLTNTVIHNLPAFHRITGCDTTSQFTGKGKLTAWKTFIKYPELLNSFGEDMDSGMADAEKFVIKLYSSASTVHTTNDLRVEMFHTTSPENMPPSSDALKQHFLRSARETIGDRRASLAHPDLPPPEQCGWKLTDGKEQLNPYL